MQKTQKEILSNIEISRSNNNISIKDYKDGLKKDAKSSEGKSEKDRNFASIKENISIQEIKSSKNHISEVSIKISKENLGSNTVRNSNTMSNGGSLNPFSNEDSRY